MKTVLHLPNVTFIHDGLIMALWKEGLDTLEIARRIGIRESQVYNRRAVMRGGCS